MLATVVKKIADVGTQRTMKLVPYYKTYNRNTGRVKSIDYEHNQLTVSVCAGHGGGDMILPLKTCHQFEPQVDDRVLLCVDESGDQPGFILAKLKKTRQQK